MELPGILLSPFLWCNATWLFLWFYQKLIHFQSENSENAKKKVVLPPNSSFFLFQAVISFFLFQSWLVLYKNQSTCSKRPAAQNASRMPCLVERFLQRSGGYLLRKCTVLMGKKFPCIFQGMKKAQLINRFFKIFQHYAPLCVFS